MNGTASNFGWQINDSVECTDDGFTTKYRTREDAAVPAERPVLHVTYTLP